MKIEEPNTPFHYDSTNEEADDEDLNESNENDSNTAPSPRPPDLAMDELRAKLQIECHRQESEEKKQADFATKRKKHYNEYQRMMELRKLNEDMNEDDMNEDDMKDMKDMKDENENKTLVE